MKPRNKIILSVSLVCALLLVSIPASAALGGLHAKPAAEPQTASAPAVSSAAAGSEVPESAVSSAQPQVSEVCSVPAARSAAVSEPPQKRAATGVASKAATVDTVKMLTIQGKAYWFQYSEQETADYQSIISGSLVYTAKDGSRLIYEKSTGRLVDMLLFDNSSEAQSAMTKEQALADCKKFIETEKEFVYLKEIVPTLTLDSFAANEQDQSYDIVFFKHLYGYYTSCSLCLTVMFNGKMKSVSYNSGNFENVKLPATFDEKPYLAKLGTLTNLNTGKINNRSLYVTSLNNLGMDYEIIPGKGDKYAGFTVIYHIALDGSPEQQPTLLSD